MKQQYNPKIIKELKCPEVDGLHQIRFVSRLLLCLLALSALAALDGCGTSTQSASNSTQVIASPVAEVTRAIPIATLLPTIVEQATISPTAAPSSAALPPATALPAATIPPTMVAPLPNRIVLASQH